MSNYSNTAQETSLTAAASSGATSITVGATTGFPASTPYTLALDVGQANEELVQVTAVAGLTLTVTRGFDSTSAVAHDIGARVRHVHSARDFRLSRDHESATAAHGIAGAVVGTSDAQTLTNKNLTSATNTFPTSLVTLAGVQTLTNKTLALGSNTVSGTTAQFNTALSDGDFATLAGTEVLTNKDLSSGTNTFPSTLATDAEVTAAISSAVSTHEADTTTHGATGAVMGTTNTQTVTNKDVSSATNTFPCTEASFEGSRDAGTQAISSGVTTVVTYTTTSTPVAELTHSAGTVTINEAGVYAISGAVDLDGLTTSDTAALLLNGGTGYGVLASDVIAGTGSNDAFNNLSVSYVGYFTASVEVSLRVRANAAVTIAAGGTGDAAQTSFRIHRIG